jgi:hypothetical protein
VRARGGALNFNDNGLDVNNYNDDNRNHNVSASAALPSRNFCLLFLFYFEALDPSAEHATDLIKRLLKEDVSFLIDRLYIKGETQKYSNYIAGSSQH